jgi:hypothetical protein
MSEDSGEARGKEREKRWNEKQIGFNTSTIQK